MTEEIKNEKFITNFIESDEFMDLTEEVACRRIDVRAAYQEGLKDKQNEFVKLMINSNPSLEAILKTKPKNRKAEEKEELKEAIKAYKNMFKMTLSWMHTPDKFMGIIRKIAGVYQLVSVMSHVNDSNNGWYNSWKNLDDFMQEMGLSISDDNTVKDLLESEVIENLLNDKDQLASIFDAGTTIVTSIDKENEYEENEAFGEGVPEHVKFSPENPTGLKMADFKKLVKNMVQVARGRKYGEIPDEKLEEKLEKSVSDSENKISREDLIKRKLELDIEKSSFN